jgi:hypothetical protein
VGILWVTSCKYLDAGEAAVSRVWQAYHMLFRFGFTLALPLINLGGSSTPPTGLSNLPSRLADTFGNSFPSEGGNLELPDVNHPASRPEIRVPPPRYVPVFRDIRSNSCCGDQFILLAVLLSITAACTVHAQDIPGFQSPSKNIACIYFEYDGHKALRCDIGDKV